MAGTKGNTNAEKWTRYTVLEMLKKIEAEAKKPTCAWLGSALVKVGLYKQVWAYWKDIFKDDKIVFEPIKKIEQIFEDRLFEKALKGEYNQTMAIFGLKNNHEWRDRKELTGPDGGAIQIEQIKGMVIEDASKDKGKP